MSDEWRAGRPVSPHMTHITHVGPVFVPVSDQDAALDFYVNTLGFEQRVDFAYADGERWVEVGPPGVSTHLTLAQARASRPAGIETGIVLGTGDVEAAHAALNGRGRHGRGRSCARATRSSSGPERSRPGSRRCSCSATPTATRS